MFVTSTSETSGWIVGIESVASLTVSDTFSFSGATAFFSSLTALSAVAFTLAALADLCADELPACVDELPVDFVLPEVLRFCPDLLPELTLKELPAEELFAVRPS